MPGDVMRAAIEAIRQGIVDGRTRRTVDDETDIVVAEAGRDIEPVGIIHLEIEDIELLPGFDLAAIVVITNLDRREMVVQQVRRVIREVIIHGERFANSSIRVLRRVKRAGEWYCDQRFMLRQRSQLQFERSYLHRLRHGEIDPAALACSRRGISRERHVRGRDGSKRGNDQARGVVIENAGLVFRGITHGKIEAHYGHARMDGIIGERGRNLRVQQGIVQSGIGRAALNTECCDRERCACWIDDRRQAIDPVRGQTGGENDRHNAAHDEGNEPHPESR